MNRREFSGRLLRAAAVLATVTAGVPWLAKAGLSRHETVMQALDDIYADPAALAKIEAFLDGYLDRYNVRQRRIVRDMALKDFAP